MVGATSSEDSLIAAALERVNCTAASLEASVILGGAKMKLRETSQMPADKQEGRLELSCMQLRHVSYVNLYTARLGFNAFGTHMALCCAAVYKQTEFI